MVGVTHWDSLEKKDILLTPDFISFFVLVRTAFSDVSIGKIRIYSLPHGFDDVGQRKRVDNEAAYSELRRAILSDDIDAMPPLVYVWNVVDDTSPG